MAEDIIKKSIHRSIRSLLNYFALIILVAGLVIYLLTGFYSISQSQVGVLQRFGKVIDGKVMPGIHYKIPWPVDKVDRVPLKVVHSISIDDFSEESREKKSTELSDKIAGLFAYCLTGDNNIVFIDFIIKYNIVDPANYLFQVQNNQQLLKEAACSAIINCLSEMPVDEIIAFGKKRTEDTVKRNLQKRLDELESGLGVFFIELKSVSPPQEVKPYFDGVINAHIDKKRIINEAESYTNSMIPEAKSKANKLIQEAMAYKKEQSSKAEGETGRFASRLSEYSKSKIITKKKMYLDFALNLYPHLDNVIIVDQSADEEKPIIDLRIFPDK